MQMEPRYGESAEQAWLHVLQAAEPSRLAAKASDRMDGDDLIFIAVL
jgi:hypothetical protein